MSTVEDLARRLDLVEARLAGLERPLGPEAVRWPPPRWPQEPQPATVWPGAPPAPPAPAPVAAVAPSTAPDRTAPALGPSTAPDRAAPTLEDLFGGRVLAWIGGVSVLAALAFLLVIAVSRGWLDEEARTWLAGLTSLGLLAVGVAAHERRGRTDAARAATSAGLAGLFATAVTATQLYEIVPAFVGLLAAFGVGAVGTALAIRWTAQGVGALGLAGALAAPLLVGAPLDDSTLTLLWIVGAAAVVVVVHQRWDWLAGIACSLTTIQWLGWLLEGGHTPTQIVVALTAFGALTAVAVAGLEWRSASPEGSAWSPLLVMGNLLTLAVAGWIALAGWTGIGDTAPGHAVADGWLAALGAAHLLAAIAVLRSTSMSRGLGLLLAGLGVAALDIAFALTGSGLVLVAGWAAVAIGFALLARRTHSLAAYWGIGVHLGLAAAHALLIEAPAWEVGADPSPATLTAIALLVAGCAACGRLVARDRAGVLDVLAVAALAYFFAHAFDGALLTVALVATAVAAGAIAGRDLPAVALALLGVALAHALVVLAPPPALLDGLADPPSAILALAAIVLAAALTARLTTDRWLVPAAAVLALYAGSVALVSGFDPGAQQGQMALSGFWALTGVAGLVAGLLRDRQDLRLGAFALLAVASAKVFLFDLASLTQLYRVGSFMAFGVLTLCGAFAWQRIRPRTPRVP